ncbi:MAG: hypothetical protein KDC90_06220 [Ignavibacteriae bacterium]|nr:hypothetical protein [Ignavibacteriota bacterium]
MKEEQVSDLGFTFIKNKKQEIIINRYGNKIAILRNKKALEFIEDIKFLNFEDQQQLIARLTGNYKRGNEKQAKKHFRNKI